MSRFKIQYGWMFLAAAVALAGCSAGMAAGPAERVIQPTVAPLPTIVIPPTATPQSSSGSVLIVSGQGYDADVRARSQVAIIPKVSGEVIAAPVAVGDSVKVGDVLVEIEHDVLDAQVGQAEAGLNAAHAMVGQAEAGLAAARANLKRAEDGATAGEKQAASTGLQAAQAAYDRVKAGPTEEDLAPLVAQLGGAEANVRLAQAQYDRVKGDPYIAMLPQSLQLQQATLAYEAAKATYDKAARGATADQLKAAEAQLALARSNNQKAQEGTPKSQIEAAQAGVQQAEAAVTAAQAQVKQAETAVNLAHLQRDNATIKSPIAGKVAVVNATVGSLTSPQSPQPLMLIVSPETEVAFGIEQAALKDVAVGAPVQITVDAYPDRTFSGRVARISPVVNPATRTVEVVAVPDDTDGLLRPGMFATVLLSER